MLFKHDAFRGEQEYRVIYSPTGPSLPRKQHFRGVGSRIIPYVELDLAGPIAVPVRSIRPARGASDSRVKMAVEAMLQDRGIKLPGDQPVPVLVSKIPFVPT